MKKIKIDTLDDFVHFAIDRTKARLDDGDCGTIAIQSQEGVSKAAIIAIAPIAWLAWRYNLTHEQFMQFMTDACSHTYQEFLDKDRDDDDDS